MCKYTLQYCIHLLSYYYDTHTHTRAVCVDHSLGLSSYNRHTQVEEIDYD
jgi:hypothetical protein